MVAKSKRREAIKVARNIDDLLHLATGKRAKDILGVTVNLIGEDLARRAAKFFAIPQEDELPVDNPYRKLGVHPDAMDVVVRGAYRALAKEYHPDTGTKPDPAKFQEVTEAYNAIVAERQEKRVPKREL
jgi:DnaJ-domain-containing protein 1